MFENSTQAKNWIFTKERLAQLREEARHIDHDPLNSGVRRICDDESKLYSVEEEITVCRCTEKEIIRIAKRLNMSDPLIYTAIVFFKRYYLYHSVTTWNPIHVALCSLFLSEKLHEGKASNLLRILKELNLNESALNASMEMIVKWLEPDLLNGLKFNLRVFLPFRPLTGLFIEISSKTKRKPEYWRTWSDESYGLVINAIRSDAIFLYSPSRIALEAIRLAAFSTIKEKQSQENASAQLKEFSIEDAQEDFNVFVQEKNLASLVHSEIEVEFYQPKQDDQQTGQATLNKRKTIAKKGFTSAALRTREKELIGDDLA